MFAMCLDNYFWIPADYKWYGTKEWKPHFKVLFVAGKNKREYIFPITKQGWKIVKSRVKDVLTQPYDIVPAIISALILTILL